MIPSGNRPANGAFRPSAIDVGVTWVGWPRSTACGAMLVSGSTAITRTFAPHGGLDPRDQTSPADGTTITSASGASSSI